MAEKRDPDRENDSSEISFPSFFRADAREHVTAAEQTSETKRADIGRKRDKQREHDPDEPLIQLTQRDQIGSEPAEINDSGYQRREPDRSRVVSALER